jgi:hypothetical protein
MVESTFDRLAEERSRLLDDLESRSENLGSVLEELGDALEAGSELARDLDTTVKSADRVVARFDPEARPSGEPLRIDDLRVAAIASSEAAERLATALERADELLARNDPRAAADAISEVADRFLTQTFWRALGLVVVLLAGLALLKRLPPATGRRAAS